MISAAPVANKSTQRLVLLVLYVILIFAAILSLIPFYWMIMSSFKPLNDILTIPVWVIPQHFTLDNYTSLLTLPSPFLRSMLNTLAVALSNVVLQVFLCS
ncbi:MAG: hypothetical protein ABI700_18240, partial [Chloroflexota bacterium]